MKFRNNYIDNDSDTNLFQINFQNKTAIYRCGHDTRIAPINTKTTRSITRINLQFNFQPKYSL